MLATVTSAVWTVRVLWFATLLMAIASILFAIVFLVGYVAQTWYPKSRFASYFIEVDLFTLWISTMFSGVGFGTMLFIAVSHYIGSSSLVETGLTGLLSVAAIASPLLGLLFLLHIHQKRRTKKRRPAKR